MSDDVIRRTIQTDIGDVVVEYARHPLFDGGSLTSFAGAYKVDGGRLTADQFGQIRELAGHDPARLDDHV